MNSSIIIRPFIDADANDISSIIIDCIKNLSNEFYDTQAIDTLCLFYTPQHILYYSKIDNIFTALFDSMVVGTISLYGDTIRNLFIKRNFQKMGIGRMLMDFIENIAKEKNINTLYVNSNISAYNFYQSLGFSFKKVKLEKIGNSFIKTVFMEKKI